MNCGPAFPANFFAAAEAGRAGSGTAPATQYILPQGAIWVITLREQNTNLTRNVRIEPGGRVSPQQ